MTELEKKAEELRRTERMMSANDELLHIEMQGVIREQQAQMEIIARMRNGLGRLVKQLEERVTDIELDRDELLTQVTHLSAECEQMHVRQNATDARLDTLKAVFDAGLAEIREANRIAHEVSKTVGHLKESVSGTTEP
jgi:ferritin-like protein